jgi:hypothetical protein
LFLSLNSLQQRGGAEAKFARSMMMDEKKGKLQDLIKSTYAIIQAHYDYAHDPQKVAAAYRGQLKSIVDVAYKTVEQIHSRNDLDDAEKMNLAAELVGAMRYNEKRLLVDQRHGAQDGHAPHQAGPQWQGPVRLQGSRRQNTLRRICQCLQGQG